MNNNYNNFKSVRNVAPEDNENIYEGVNINDRTKLVKAYNRLKRRHAMVSIISFCVLIFLGFFAFDFFNVNFNGGQPLLALKSKTDGGTLYTGVGYKALYCDNGDVYTGLIGDKSCLDSKLGNTFQDIVYKSFTKYATDNKLLDKSNLSKLTINVLEHDSDNGDETNDYYIEFDYICTDGTSKCFKTLKETNNQTSVKGYLTFAKGNLVTNFVVFKNNGKHYDAMIEGFTQNIRNYLVSNGHANNDNLRYLNVNVLSTHGLFKYNGVIYADSYEIKVNYVCNDNGNTCITGFENSSNENLVLYLGVLLDDNGNVSVVNTRSLFDI